MHPPVRVPAAALTAALVALACGPAAPPAAPPAIAGSHPLVHWRESGGSTVGVEPADALFIEAQLDGADGPEIRPAALTDDGRFRIEGSAPKGAYWLRVFDGTRTGEDVYLWTGATELDLGHDVAGRDGTVLAHGRDTRLVIDAAGLAPLEEGDQTDFVLANLGYSSVGAGTYYATNNPQPGDTALQHLTLAWAGFPLASSAEADRAVFTQLRRFHDDRLGLDYVTPIKSFATAPFSMQEGASTTIGGTFTDVKPLEFPFFWARSAFAALRPDIHPARAGEANGQAFWVHANPGGGQHGDLFAWAPRVIDDVVLPDGTGDLAGTLHAGTPYPAAWQLAKYELTFPVTYEAPDRQPATNNLLASIGVITNATSSAQAPVKPLVGPPGAPQVNGKDLFSSVSGVGTTPTISWSKPALGTATSWELHLIVPVVQHHYVPRVYTTLVFQEVALLLVPGDVTSVRLPRELLESDGTYLLRIRAVSRAGENLATAPFRSAVPLGYADVCTDYFRP